MPALAYPVTETDFQRLTELLEMETQSPLGNARPHLETLREKLAESDVVGPLDLPPDVVTMHSTMYLHDCACGETDVYTLVYPERASIADGRLSILSPLGVSVFAQRVGDTVKLHAWDNASSRRIGRLAFQPERVGAFNL
ncbi:GreA/GreB family elongation factor [Roseimaritima sediminicola]|uniref:GreA/GreB family elongation factor n=1 Tax=Roseimaritima sediminicola TaxID=2662066 RepID=UPI0012982E91|nr:GreA/GreB family elongation factor [Roseimaritima sediminicola]